MGNIVVFKNFSNFSEYLNQKNFILLDGATGTLIQKSGVKYDHVPEVLNITHPELIESFHRRYIDAGSWYQNRTEGLVYENLFEELLDGYHAKFLFHSASCIFSFTIIYITTTFHKKQPIH